MEKILVGIDGVNPDGHALDFACYLAKLTRTKVTGVFLEDSFGDEYASCAEPAGVSVVRRRVDKSSNEYRNKNAVIENSITLFKEACEKRTVRHSIHKEEGSPAAEIIYESRFADVLVVNAETSFNNDVEGIPSQFVKDVLKDAECPVVIAPEKFEGIDELVFIYDGSRSCMIAIKQFTYLFPQLEDLKLTVLTVDKDGFMGEGKNKFKEWLSGHYSAVYFEALKDDTVSTLYTYLGKKKNVFLIRGNYSRNTTSVFFRTSEVDFLMRVETQGVFLWR